MGGFDQMEASGIADTHMEDTLSFDVASWLTHRMPGKVVIASDHYDPGRRTRHHRLALTASRLLFPTTFWYMSEIPARLKRLQ
jgi:hypothetical protein